MPPVPPPAGLRTTVAPFAAVPTPEPEPAPGPVATALDERPSASRAAVSARPSRSAAVPSLPPRPASAAAAPVVPRSPSIATWHDDEHDAPWMTGRGAVRAPRVPGRTDGDPFVERRASRLPAGGMRPSTGPADLPEYGDWTKPSGAGRAVDAAPALAPAVPAAPLTTAIPDRDVAGRRSSADDDPPRGSDSDRYADAYDADAYDADAYAVRGYEDAGGDDDDYDDEYDDGDHDVQGYDDAGYDDAGYDDGDYDDAGYDDGDRDDLDRRALAASPDTGSGPVPGGRAASRAARQAREESRVAAEAARRKAARRSGQVSLDDEDDGPRRPRRLLTGVVAVGAVAAAMLGVYTFTTPDAEVAGAQSAATSSAPSSAPTSAPAVTAALPPLDTSPEPVEAAPAAPVRVPVTVLNATTITGLAADVSAAISGSGTGWRTGTPGGYPNGDIAATTVYYVEGNDKQRQAALQLKEQFPQLSGPAVRFFEVPAEVRAPGLVVVAAGDWKP